MEIHESRTITTFARKSTAGDGSTHTSADPCESGLLSSSCDKCDTNDDGKLTGPTSTDGDSPSLCCEETLKGKYVARKCLIQDDLFPDLNLNARVFAAGTTYSEPNADSEDRRSPIDLEETDVEPRQRVTDTLGRIEDVLRHFPISAQESMVSRYYCKTEPDSICSIYLDIRFPRTIHRWAKGSIITFNVDWKSFLISDEHARHAAMSLQRAAEEWNKGDVGVRFERANDDEKAVFQLTYSQYYRRDTRRLAHSFFPGDPPEEQLLYVYGPAFTQGNYHWLENIFCHELGHVLGLRHEFAETSREEQRHPSAQLGENNALSVMNYFNHPSMIRIQESDYDGARRFYNFYDREYCGSAIVDENPRYFESPGLRKPPFFLAHLAWDLISL